MDLSVNSKWPGRLLGLLVTAGILYLITMPAGEQGLTATYYSGSNFASERLQQVEQVAMLDSNDGWIDASTPFSIRWRGYLWIPRSGEYAFDVPDDLPARLVIGEQTIFDMGDAKTDSGQITVNLESGLYPLTFELAQPNPDGLIGYFSARLTWDNGQLVGPPYLYPELPNETQQRTIIWRMRLHWAAIWLAGLATAGLMAFHLGRTWQTDRREVLFCIGVVVLAITLRLVYLNDLLAAIPNFDAMPLGSDHRGYVGSARALVRGLWPPPQAFYIQPGFTWLLGQVFSLTGASLRAYQIVQLLGSALAGLGCYALGKQIFGVWVGRVAAVLWAIFPLAIFYDLQLVTHGLEMQLIVWLMWLGLGTITRLSNDAPGQWRWLLAFGVLLGGAAVVRPSFLVFAPLAALAVAAASWPRWQVGLGRITALTLLTCLPILPVTYHNYRHSGQFVLISSNGPVNLYLDNNRTTSGLGEYSPAFRATHERVNRGEAEYVNQTLAEIRADPGRWLGLTIRKTALYFSNIELPNNIDFYLEGRNISPLLRAIPLGYGLIAALGLAGLIIGLTKRQTHTPGIWLLGITVAVLASTTITFHVVSRFRVPSYGPLIVLSAFTLVEFVRSAIQRNRVVSLRLLGVIAASSTLVAALPWVAEHSMAHPVVSELPSDVIHLETDFGEMVRLLGYAPLPAVDPGEPLFVTLYWQATSNLPENYYSSVQLLTPEGGKLAQADQIMGTGSFPDYFPVEWPPGEIIQDSTLLFMPKDATLPLGLDILVVVYDRDNGQRLGEARFGSLAFTHAEPLPPLPDEAAPVGVTLGPAELVAYTATLQDEIMILTLYWQANDVSTSDGVVFVHLLDANGEYVAGQDRRPHNGNYPIHAWQPGEGVVDVRQIPVSGLAAGEYQLLAGIYDPATGERFSAVDRAGNVLSDGTVKLGTIAIPAP